MREQDLGARILTCEDLEDFVEGRANPCPRAVIDKVEPDIFIECFNDLADESLDHEWTSALRTVQDQEGQELALQRLLQIATGILRKTESNRDRVPSLDYKSACSYALKILGNTNSEKASREACALVATVAELARENSSFGSQELFLMSSKILEESLGDRREPSLNLMIQAASSATKLIRLAVNRSSIEYSIGGKSCIQSVLKALSLLVRSSGLLDQRIIESACDCVCILAVASREEFLFNQLLDISLHILQISSWSSNLPLTARAMRSLWSSLHFVPYLDWCGYKVSYVLEELQGFLISQNDGEEMESLFCQEASKLLAHACLACITSRWSFQSFSPRAAANQLIRYLQLLPDVAQLTSFMEIDLPLTTAEEQPNKTWLNLVPREALMDVISGIFRACDNCAIASREESVLADLMIALDRPGWKKLSMDVASLLQTRSVRRVGELTEQALMLRKLGDGHDGILENLGSAQKSSMMPLNTLENGSLMFSNDIAVGGEYSRIARTHSLFSAEGSSSSAERPSTPSDAREAAHESEKLATDSSTVPESSSDEDMRSFATDIHLNKRNISDMMLEPSLDSEKSPTFYHTATPSPGKFACDVPLRGISRLHSCPIDVQLLEPTFKPSSCRRSTSFSGLSAIGQRAPLGDSSSQEMVSCQPILPSFSFIENNLPFIPTLGERDVLNTLISSVNPATSLISSVDSDKCQVASKLSNLWVGRPVFTHEAGPNTIAGLPNGGSSATSTSIAESDDVSLEPTRHLWIGNLSPRTSRVALKSIFEIYGVIEDIVTFPGRMYAFVNFENVEEAERAVDSLQGRILLDITLDRPLILKYRPSMKAAMFVRARPGSECSGANTDAPDAGCSHKPTQEGSSREPSPRLWLGNIAPEASSATLHAVLGQFGKLIDAAVFPARVGPLGYAFVRFENINDAIEAYRALNNTIVPALSGSKQLKMRYKQGEGPSSKFGGLAETPKAASVPSRHLWLGNIVKNPSEETLKTAFTRFGRIESVRLFSSKSYAFINFVDVASGVVALQEMDGRAIPSLTGEKPVVIRFQNHNQISQTLDGVRNSESAFMKESLAVPVEKEHGSVPTEQAWLGRFDSTAGQVMDSLFVRQTSVSSCDSSKKFWAEGSFHSLVDADGGLLGAYTMPESHSLACTTDNLAQHQGYLDGHMTERASDAPSTQLQALLVKLNSLQSMRSFSGSESVYGHSSGVDDRSHQTRLS